MPDGKRTSGEGGAEAVRPLYSRAEDFAVRSIAGETILVPIRSGAGDLESIFLLNETGSVVWQAVATAPDTRTIVEAVAERFDVPREEAARDVDEYLASLEEAGLIRRLGEVPS